MQLDDAESTEDVGSGADLEDATVRTVVVDAIVSNVEEDAPAKHTMLSLPFEVPGLLANGTDRIGDSDLSDE